MWGIEALSLVPEADGGSTALWKEAKENSCQAVDRGFTRSREGCHKENILLSGIVKLSAGPWLDPPHP